jgi:hypothetical protein
MRSKLRPNSPRSYSLIETFVQAVSDVGRALQLLGDLIAPRTHTARKTDLSEPPDMVLAIQAV